MQDRKEEFKKTNLKAQHILCLSGGKDSTALALYLRDKIPNMIYVFSDTGKELPETYDYLHKVEALLGKQIVYLSSDRDFDHWIAIYGGYLPSPRMRWCTKVLKIRPFEEFVGDTETYLYIGIRADEDREGYISTKSNITPKYPFKDDGLVLEDIYQILEESGLGLPDYYKWRTRSGCYFCFFQRKREWVGLLQNHPDLFELSINYEKSETMDNTRFTWNESESLRELSQPERVQDIIERAQKRMEALKGKHNKKRLVEVFSDMLDDEDSKEPCLICNL